VKNLQGRLCPAEQTSVQTAANVWFPPALWGSATEGGGGNDQAHFIINETLTTVSRRVAKRCNQAQIHGGLFGG
jgi:hypothetical protein